ncbi:defective proboscis extension response 1 isoform X1 [Cotesia typhae]|uniref:defective proboscis extension response 1 isoform X1 n=1 Tax=Cotesia typhae TaxID=2053667 RepID=UPI003D692D69
MSNKHLQIKLNGELIEPSIIVGSSCLTKMILYLLIGLLVMETRTAQGLLFRDHRTNEHNSLNDWPYFEENVPRNVTTAISQTAFLHCRVHQRGDKEVSWMRQRDMHIISAGISTYTSDLRFQVIHPDKSENWTLQIKSPQERDSGVYECQVSTEPKMSLNYTLNVVEPQAQIMAKGDIYVKTGSVLTLNCRMSQGPHDLGTVAWFRDNQPVVTSARSENDVDQQPRITVETEWSEALESRLKIFSARVTDSGNYSCVPTTAKRASVIVHVINGEHPAAMQHGNTAVGMPTSGAYLLLALIIGQFR